jgi:hypothetical protein
VRDKKGAGGCDTYGPKAVFKNNQNLIAETHLESQIRFLRRRFGLSEVRAALIARIAF